MVGFENLNLNNNRRDLVSAASCKCLRVNAVRFHPAFAVTIGKLCIDYGILDGTCAKHKAFE